MLEPNEVAKLEKLLLKRQRKIYARYAGLIAICVFFVIICLYLIITPSSNNDNVAYNTTKVNNTQQQQQINSNNNVINNNITAENTARNNMIAENEIREKVERAKELQLLKEQVRELKALQDLQTLQALKDRERQNLNLQDNISTTNGRSAENVASEVDMSSYFEPTSEPVQKRPTKQEKAATVVQNTQRNNTKGSVKITSSDIKTVKTDRKLEVTPSDFHNMTTVDRDPKEAYRLATDYYTKRDYENAAKWAFELNDIDKNNPDGWIIFAKAKYNSGKKKDAIKVLEIYKSRAGNPGDIQALITRMRNNDVIE